MILTHTVTNEEEDTNIKTILRNKLLISSNLLKRLKTNNRIFLNGDATRVIETVKCGDVITIDISFADEVTSVTPEYIPINILYEDEYLIALNKPSGMVVHPCRGYPSGTLANALMHYLLEKNKHIKVRPVGRLDRETSGIVVFAKNQHIQKLLVSQMQQTSIYKEYLAIVEGVTSENTGTIDLPIERTNDSIILREVSELGRKSITHYSVVEIFNCHSLIKFVIETGRTHQIRVHSKAIGHPLIGDGLYGSGSGKYINRLALHAHKNEFIHPIALNKITLHSKLPCDMITALEIMRINCT